MRSSGFSHRELLALRARPAAHIVDGVIEAGTPGTVAGLPETYKSWLGLETALKLTARASSEKTRTAITFAAPGARDPRD